VGPISRRKKRVYRKRAGGISRKCQVGRARKESHGGENFLGSLRGLFLKRRAGKREVNPRGQLIKGGADLWKGVGNGGGESRDRKSRPPPMYCAANGWGESEKKKTYKDSTNAIKMDYGTTSRGKAHCTKKRRLLIIGGMRSRRPVNGGDDDSKRGGGLQMRKFSSWKKGPKKGVCLCGGRGKGGRTEKNR